jgi:hypothetical protein
VGEVVPEHLARQSPLLPGAGVLAFIDIDSMQKRVYGHHKQGARFGHTKIGPLAQPRAGERATRKRLNASALPLGPDAAGAPLRRLGAAMPHDVAWLIIDSGMRLDRRHRRQGGPTSPVGRSWCWVQGAVR